MENPNPTRNPGREPGIDNDDDGDVGRGPRHTREQDENPRPKRQIPHPNQRPDETPKTA